VKAIEDCARLGRRKYEVASRTTLAETLLHLRQPDTGLESARAAAAGADGLGHPPAVWRAHELLARALEANGENGDADRATAVAVFNAFAEALSEDDRRMLLASPSAERMRPGFVDR
jgi:hypothetical protein